MKKEALKGILSLAAILVTCITTSQVPRALTGNWLATDGSNRYVIGIYPQVACFENNTWQIKSATKQNDHWELALQGKDELINLALNLQDSNTLVLSRNNQQLVLKNTRTYNYTWKPVEKSLIQPSFATMPATIKGYIHFPKKRDFHETYIQVSYDNELTGETAYFLNDIDSIGRFTVSLPLYRARFCTLTVNDRELVTVFVQPGNTTLVAVNQAVELSGDNPDYSKLMQRICMMGDDGDFNNQYQHFAIYYGKPTFEFPSKTIKGKSLPEKKEQQFLYYTDLYNKYIKTIQNLYEPGKANRQFIDFIKEEVKYECAYALLSNLRDESGERTYGQYRIDSSDLQKIYTLFLEQESPNALMHTSFYKLANRYADQVQTLKGSNRLSYSIDKMDERVEKEYGPLISGNFLQIYKQLQKDYMQVSKMKDQEIIDKYFKGNRDEAVTYRYLQRKIWDEFRKEASDSANYVLYKRELKKPLLRFAANVSQLVTSHSGDDVELPSLYRIKLFREYSSMTATPWRLVDSLTTLRAMDLAMASMEVKWNESLIKEVSTEADWQTALGKYRGKTVVICMFSHYFREDNVQQCLYELKKLRELYKGKNVVFLKCIQQRQRSDRIKQLLGYLRVMKSTDELNDLFYIDRTLSVGLSMSEAINKFCAIYNEEGQLHHPIYHSYSYSEKKQEELTIQAEMELVMTGKGRYYENFAEEFFRMGHMFESYSKRRGPLATWTLFASSGKYFTYIGEEPDKPFYGREQDTVFSQVTFLTDSLFVESKMIMHQLPLVRDKRSLFPEYRYEKDVLQESKVYYYQFDKKSKTIIIKDKQGKLQKQLRIVFITPKMMILELVE